MQALGDDRPDMWEILPDSLWQSASPLDWTAVTEIGIDTIVDVNGDGDRRLEPAGWFRSESILYVFWPLADARLPDPADLSLVLALILGRIESGHRVLVQCSQGLNRSGLLSSMVIQSVRGGTGADALDYLQGRRVRPMSNPAFVEHVRGLPVTSVPGDR